MDSPKSLALTAVFVPAEEGGYTAYIEGMRGIVSEGDTLQEARENLIDALQLMLEAPQPQSAFGHKDIVRESFKIVV